MSDDVVVIDQRPGFYYVSVVDGGRVARIRGPFTDHASALAAVDPARDDLLKIDPRAAFWAFGTFRSAIDLGQGYLNASVRTP